MAKNDFQYGGWYYYTLQRGTIMTLISPSDCTLSWQWIHQVAAPCNVTRSFGIMPLNSSGGSTLQCGRWLWDDMPWNSPKRPPYWNYTSGFEFDHITAVDMLFCASVQICFPNLTALSRKKTTLCRFSRWRISAILDCRSPIMFFLKLMHDSYRSSTDTKNALGCTDSCRLLSFWEHLLFAFWRQDPRWGISYSIGQTKSGAGTTKLAPSASWALNICLTASPVLFATTDLILVQISPKFNRTIRNPLPVYSETFVMMGVLVLLLGNKKRH